MAYRYQADHLLHLRDSPLCIKPPNLPQAEDWMGPPPEHARIQIKTTTDRPKLDNPLLDPNNRRIGLERHSSRNSSSLCSQIESLFKSGPTDTLPGPKDTEEIILGPPRNSFASSTFPVSKIINNSNNNSSSSNNNSNSNNNNNNNGNSGNTANNSSGNGHAANKGTKLHDNDKSARDNDPSTGRFAFRNRNGDPDTGDRLRDARSGNARRRVGDSEQDDSEGWSTVKPRKSFGHDGAERFHGRMGAAGERRAGATTTTTTTTTDDRRQRDRDRDDNNNTNGTKERPARNFEALSRDNRDKDKEMEKDGDDGGEGRPRIGLPRGKSEPWFKQDLQQQEPILTARERIEKVKSWRDREKQPEPSAAEDRNSARRYDNSISTNNNRWSRDREPRVEKDPEWLDDPAEEKSEKHTEEDFKKFMESMKAGRNKAAAAAPAGAGAKAAANAAAAATIEAVKPKVVSAPAVESGPDRFFMTFASNISTDQNAAPSPDTNNELIAKAKAGGPKASRFTSFFAQTQTQEEVKAKMDPPTPAAGPPPPPNGGVGPAGILESGNGTSQDDEKEAFQQLLAKLQRQTLNDSSPPPMSHNLFQEPSQPPQQHQQHQPHQPHQPHQQPQQQHPPQHLQHLQHLQQQQQQQQQQHQNLMQAMFQKPASGVTSPEPYQQPFPGGRQDDPRRRAVSANNQEILQPRPMLVNQTQHVRSEQILQEFMAQHPGQHMSPRGGALPPNQQQHPLQQPPPPQQQQPLLQQRSMNLEALNHEFLSGLMRTPPDSRLAGQLLMGQGQPKPYQQMQMQMQMQDREQPDYGRPPTSMRQMRPQPPPGFMDEHFHLPPEKDMRPPPPQGQPTQILQRGPQLPPPLGLDQVPPGWMTGAGQLPPPQSQQPQQRPLMMPPPGLANAPSRNMAMPTMYPPNFPPGAYPPPPDAALMVGPPRNMPPPPPPPGFFPPAPPPPGFVPHGMVFPGPLGPEHGFAAAPPFDVRHMPPQAAGGNMFRRQ